MAVYVDNALITASVPNGDHVVQGRWCHMTADTRDELDGMADRIGLSRAWIQRPGTHREHYDVTEPMRAAAILAGAVEVDWQEHAQTWGRERRLRMGERDSPLPIAKQVEIRTAEEVPDHRTPTVVVNVRTHSADVYIGRGSDWGNPFRIGEHGSRAQVIHAYEAHLQGRADLINRLHELRGRRLGCYCSPNACHGDVLARYADMSSEELRRAVSHGVRDSALPPAPRRTRTPRTTLEPPASFLAIDFETCMAQRASPIQIGVVRVIDGVVGRTNTSPIMPPPGFRTFERGAQRIHGLTPDYIAGAPEWPAILARIVRIATDATGALLPLVAHNASFERSVIVKTTEAVGMPLPDFTYFDTVLYARQELPDVANHKLNTLVEHLGLGPFQHHDAGEDARLTARLLLTLSGRRRTDGTTLGATR